MITEVKSAEQMMELGARIGAFCSGGEVIELVGDIGAGKTTFTKGLARALGVHDDVQSPTFTISRLYDTDSDLQLAHYDFYRLQDAGVLSMELAETMHDSATVTVIEWANAVSEVLPDDELRITIRPTAEDYRTVELTAKSGSGAKLLEQLA